MVASEVGHRMDALFPASLEQGRPPEKADTLDIPIAGTRGTRRGPE
jgi:hypothetical protein